MSKPILGYWDIRGYGQPIRFLLAYIGVDYEDKLYPEEREADWLADKFNLGLEFPNLPYWIEGDLRITETKAIIRYLAREKGGAQGLFPTDPTAIIKVDMIENVIMDVWTMIANYAYNNTDGDKEGLKTRAPLKFKDLSEFLGTKSFLIGDKPTFVDFTFYEILYFFTAYDANYLNPYPNLVEYKKRFEAIPEIAAYIKSPSCTKRGCTFASATAAIGY